MRLRDLRDLLAANTHLPDDTWVVVEDVAAERITCAESALVDVVCPEPHYDVYGFEDHEHGETALRILHY